MDGAGRLAKSSIQPPGLFPRLFMLRRYYGKSGVPRLIRIDYHGAKEVPTGTCHAVLKAAGLKVGKPHD